MLRHMDSDAILNPMTLRRDVLCRIGGPNAITWPSFYITLGFTLILGALGASAAGIGWQWVAPSLAGQVVAYIVLWSARVTVLRRARDRPLPTRTLVAFIIAAVIGSNASGALASTLFGDDLNSGGPGNPLIAASAILATIVSFTIVASFASVIVDAYREHTAWTSLRDSKLRRIRDLRTSGVAFINELHDRWLEMILRELGNLQQQTPHRGLQDLETSIRHAAFDVLRPLSHELATGTLTDFPEAPPVAANFREFLSDSMSSRPIRPIRLALLSAIPPGFFCFFHAGWSDALIFLVSSTLGVILFGSLFALLIERAQATKSRLGAGGIAILFLTAFPVPLASVVLPSTITVQAAVASSFAILVFGLFGPTLSAGRLAFVAEQRDREAIEQALAREEGNLRLKERLERKSLSTIIHGRIQSTLLACALNLARINRQEQKLQDEAARQQVQHALDQMVDLVRSAPEEQELARGLDDIASVWSGLCSIDVDVDRASLRRLNATETSAVLVVVEELCTNAIRHGSAHRIHVGVSTKHRDHVSIEVTSNENEPTNSTTRGLGSTLLDEMTLSWTRETTADGTKTLALVPISRRSA